MEHEMDPSCLFHENIGDFCMIRDSYHMLGQEGHYGVTYMGQRLSKQQQVVIKTSKLHKEYFDKEEFDQEMESLTKVSAHENIVKIYDVQQRDCEANGSLELWMVAEFCRLGNLKAYASQKDLSIDQKIELMYQSARGVYHLHQCPPQGIAHTNIKPENLLLSGTPENPVVKICDYGIGRDAVRKAWSPARLKSLLEMPNYLAPEQTEWKDGEMVEDKHVDTFSLGVIFLALLQCSKGSIMEAPTEDGQSLGKLMWQKKWYPSFAKFKPDIDKTSDNTLEKAIKNIIGRMIQLKPSDRISMAEVIDRLAGFRETTLERTLVAVDRRALWLRTESSSWDRQLPLPCAHPIMGVCICGVSKGIVVVGGIVDGIASSLCHRFDLSTRCWRRLPNMPTPRANASVAVLVNRLYVLGGADGKHATLNTCERFNLTDEEWSSAKCMKDSLWQPLVAAAIGKLFILPHGPVKPSTMLQEYNPVTDTFTWAAELPANIQSTAGATMISANNDLYLMGGKHQLALQYDVDAGHWSKLASRPTASYAPTGLCGALLNGKVLVCGGSRPGKDSNVVEEYDTWTQEWHMASFSLPFPYNHLCSHVVSVCL